MLNENCGRYRTLVKNIKADSNEVLAVTLWKVSNRTNKSSFRLTEFRSSFRRCILPHNDAVFSPARFLKGTEGTERARIINSPNHHVAGVRETQVLAHRFKAGPEFPVTLQISHAAIRRAWQHLIDSHEQSRQPHAWKISSAFQFEQQNLVRF